MWAQTGFQPTATAFNTELEKVAKTWDLIIPSNVLILMNLKIFLLNH
ncbi:MAG: hypothetical protein CM1200mP33_1500 [Chloroflexota bacterium]|nr:MAG: hypothetical protein CM1200mP33_1500 [Chloroflexota bacterium]